jgi:hypothetical protein
MEDRKMKEKKIKQIPYGLANYERLVQKNCYFVDKTILPVKNLSRRF